MHSSFWLPGAVAVVVLLLLASLVCTRTPGDRFSWFWEIGALLLVPWPLAYFQWIATTTARAWGSRDPLGRFISAPTTSGG